MEGVSPFFCLYSLCSNKKQTRTDLPIYIEQIIKMTKENSDDEQEEKKSMVFMRWRR